MRVLFAGTPEVAVPSLHALHRAGYLAGVLANPDRPKGRSGKAVPGPVAVAAARLDVPLLQPERLNAPAREAVGALDADLMVCFAYGKIFGPRFLSLFSAGSINIHPSLLPRHRGPTPLSAAILSGDPVTGVTIQRIGREMDAGEILYQLRLPLSDTTDVVALSEVAARRGAEAAVAVVRALDDGAKRGVAISELPQLEDRATYCSLVDDGALRIDWTEPAAAIARMIRAYADRKGPWTLLEGERVRLLEGCVAASDALPAVTAGGDASLRHAAPGGIHAPGPGRVLGLDSRKGILIQTGDGVLVLRRLQPSARKPMDSGAFVNGRPAVLDARFGE